MLAGGALCGCCRCQLMMQAFARVDERKPYHIVRSHDSSHPGAGAVQAVGHQHLHAVRQGSGQRAVPEAQDLHVLSDEQRQDTSGVDGLCCACWQT